MNNLQGETWIPFADRIQIVRHQSFKKSLATCLEIDRAPAGTILFVAAASGAGKTALSKLIGPMLYGQNFAEDIQPYIRVSAENPQAGYFTSKYLLSEMLAGFRDPFTGMTFDIPTGVPPELMIRLGRAFARTATGERATEEAKRRSLIGISQALKCRMLIIDEGNLMSIVKMGRPVESHLESLRCLALKMGVRVVILGTFLMLDFVDYSAQINRLGIIEHLDRLRNETQEGMIEFLGFLDRVEADLGITSEVLVQSADALYDDTYGIPGELISLLERARIISATQGKSSIGKDDLEKASPIPTVRARMRAEANFVEAFVRGDVQELKRFDHSLRRQVLARSAGWGQK